MTTPDAPAPTTGRRRPPGEGRRRAVLRVLGNVGWTLLLPTVLLGVWWFATANSTSFFNPPLSEILRTFAPTWFGAGGEGLADSRLTHDVLPSIGRLLAGLAVAGVVGILAGVAIGLSRGLRAFVEPVLEFFRALPPPIMVPVLVLFFGIDTTMKVVVIAFGTLWPILLNTVEGVRGLDPVLRDTARAYRLGRVALLTKLILPGAAPQIVTGARQALSIGIILMVISEMFAAKDGLGFSIVQFQRSFAVPEMWSGVILLGLLGLLLAQMFRLVTDRILAWYHGYLQSQRGGA